MSYNVRTGVAMAVLLAASFGSRLAIVAGADEPIASEEAPGSTKEAPRERYLLMKDDRLIRGVVTRDETGYVVTRSIGVIRFPKKQVERSFDTVREAYQYKLERLPDEDPAERVRFARWCLNLHLYDEARVQLAKVLALSPDHGPARAMLANLSRPGAHRDPIGEMKVDAGVQQAGAEEIVEDRPGALDSSVLRGAERGMGITGLPVIFDLPTAEAVRRTAEFRQYVHPLLQAYCAKCHNAEHDGAFQLVPVKASRQPTSDALRANLDATLRFIDPVNPAKSELLSSTLRPHGDGPRKRPLFPGSNNRAYQILATWANSLRSSAGAETGPAAGKRAASEDGESFAADRNRSGAPALEQLVQGIRTGDPRRLPSPANVAGQGPSGPAYRYTEEQGMVPEDLRQADPREFPLPYMMGGPRPSGAVANPRSPRAMAERAGSSAAAPAATRGERGTVAEGGKADATARDVPDPASPAPSPPKTKKKPVKVDPAILERLLQRNANRTAE